MKKHFADLILLEIQAIFTHINYQIGRGRIRSYQWLRAYIDEILRLTRLYEL